MTSRTKRIPTSLSDRMATAILHAALVPVVCMALMWIAIAWLTPQINAVAEASRLSGVAYGVYVIANFVANNVSTSFVLFAAVGFLIGHVLGRKPR